MSVNDDGRLARLEERYVDPVADGVQEFVNKTSPKLVQEETEGNVVVERTAFEPIVVTRLGGTLPWETDSMQLQCGETVTSNNGDMNFRLVYECVCTHSQFKTLKEMRANPDEIKLVSRSYTGTVTFDELKFDRLPDANGGIIRGEGLNTEPRYKVQLQSKEDDRSS